MYTTKIPLQILIQLFKTQKTFIVFNTDNKNNCIKSFTFTDDLMRYYRSGINSFRVVDQVKKDIKKQLKFYI